VWQFGKWELFWLPSPCYAVRISMNIEQNACGNSLKHIVKDRVPTLGERLHLNTQSRCGTARGPTSLASTALDS
jgi:hypothetical protein